MYIKRYAYKYLNEKNTCFVHTLGKLKNKWLYVDFVEFLLSLLSEFVFLIFWMIKIVIVFYMYTFLSEFQPKSAHVFFVFHLKLCVFLLLLWMKSLWSMSNGRKYWWNLCEHQKIFVWTYVLLVCRWNMHSKNIFVYNTFYSVGGTKRASYFVVFQN